MTLEESFAARIRKRYPEGLTGIIAVGGTRTTYILEHNRTKADPGRIENFEDYADFALRQYLNIIDSFFALGGQNIIVPVQAYQTFHERGDSYAAMVSRLTLTLVADRMRKYYEENLVDPYFVGIDTLLHLPPDQPAYNLGVGLRDFQQSWQYDPSRRKVIWEIAPIPLYSFWRAHEVMGQEAESKLASELLSATDMESLDKHLFSYYAQASIGTEIPVPHFYVGTNRNGDLKLRSMVPIALICGAPLRFFYLPYPSLYMTQETLKTIIEDVAFGHPSRSKQYDYREQYTPEAVMAEYRRVRELSEDPTSTIGLSRDWASDSS